MPLKKCLGWAMVLAFGLSLGPQRVTAADSQPPAVSAVSPGPGQVSVLTNLTVTFTEPVVGVQAFDLQINGLPATGVSGSGATYQFQFSSPAPGTVSVHFDSDHGITDPAGNGFDALNPAALWTYELQDLAPPFLVRQTPVPGAVVRYLTQLELVFSEPVQGLEATDLVVNGQAASAVAALGPVSYLFTFDQPASGLVRFSWASGHNIQDLAGNAMTASAWDLTLEPTAEFSGLVINEFLADNLTSLRDETGERVDWIELANRGSRSINLTGWALTDDPNAPDRWTFPALTLAPGKYLVVFASGRDIKTTSANKTNHLSFRLSAGGGYLGLFSPESPREKRHDYGQNYPAQRGDASYGLKADNTAAYFLTSTPGGLNQEGSAAAEFVRPPHASVKSGFFNQPFRVVLSCEVAEANIRYTLDGSVPLATSLAYTEPIPISGSKDKAVIMLRAAAFKPGLLPSTSITRTYIFPDQVLYQPAQPAGFPALWDSPGSTSQNRVDVPGDYEMDPQVITNAAGYAAMARTGLVAIPTVSIVTSTDLLFGPERGVYVRREDWNQRPVNVELILPDGTEGFNIPAGLEIQGGTSPYDSGASWKSLKLSLRLLFRGDFGPTRLRYRVFPDSPVDNFNTLVLDAGLNMMWHYMPGDDQRKRAQHVRDQFVSDLQQNLSGFGPHGRFVHLYLNGLYWGLYNLHERPDDAFNASYFGGENEEYDVLRHNAGSVVSGSATVYNSMFNLARSGLDQEANYQSLQQYLDLPNFIDYMLVNFWVGNSDWAHQNWYAARRRTPDGRFRYFSWDAEHVLKSAAENATTRNNKGGPTELFHLLRTNAEFRLTFADRVYRHFFSGGTFYTDGSQPVWNVAAPEKNQPASLYLRRIQEVDPAIVADSARWGDVGSTRVDNPCTRNGVWMSELNALLGIANTSGFTWNFFPTRTATVWEQLRQLELYPSVEPPGFSHPGGLVPAGYQLTFTQIPSGATVYYTLNGVDPRVYGSGAVAPEAQLYDGVPLTLTQSSMVKARSWRSGEWSALHEAEYTVGSLGIPLRITEIMYHPLGDEGDEFIELRNLGLVPLDLSGYTLSGVDYVFPSGTVVAPGALLVLAASPQFNRLYPNVIVAGYYGGKLDNAGERLAIKDAAGTIILSVDYADREGWPAAADGLGYSLEIIDPLGDPDDPANWRASSVLHGTPGQISSAPNPSPVVINELLADNVSAVPLENAFPDWVELYNAGSTAVDLSQWSLSDNENPRRFVFPDQTHIAPGEFLVIWCDNATNSGNELHAGFAFDRSADQVFLYDQHTNRVDGVRFGQQVSDYSLGRLAGKWQLTRPTPGRSNILVELASTGNLCLNEWLADSPAGGADWLELYNRATDAPVALSGLYLGADQAIFQFHALAFVPAGGHIRFLADEQPGLYHLDFKLPADGASLAIYDNAARVLDRIVYEKQSENVSQGRLPDGGPALVYFPGSSSPGSSNDVIVEGLLELNEVLATPGIALTNPVGHSSDWIELYNPGSTTVTLDGWSLSLDRPESGQWTFPAGLDLPAQSYLVIWCDPQSPATSQWPANWLNTGRGMDRQSGAVYLFNPAGQIADSAEFGFQVEGLSLGRSDGQWHLLAEPTPGQPNSPPVALGDPRQLRLNEWLTASPENPSDNSSNTGSSRREETHISPLIEPRTHSDPSFLTSPAALNAGSESGDWFELYNPQGQPVLLSGLYVTDDPSINGMTNHVFSPLSYIGPDGFVRIKADGKTGLGRDHVSFSLDQYGETLRLYEANLNLIDAVDFGWLTPGVSQGRYPDGSDHFELFPYSPTPGWRNSIEPEIILPPRSQLVSLGDAVEWKVAANGKGPWSYQWQHDGQVLALATNASLILTHVSNLDAGLYGVVLTNPAAAWGSSNLPFHLTVVTPPSAVKAVVGQTATLSVTVASVIPVSYQWQKEDSDMVQATNATLTFSPVTMGDQARYTVWLTTAEGRSAFYQAALEVLAPPRFREPQLAVGGNFSVWLEGEPGQQYQIEVTSNLIDWRELSTVRAEHALTLIEDPQASTETPRFYRARCWP